MIATASAQTPDPLALDGLAHVALRVGNVPALREFYQKLGFEQSFEFGDAQGTATSYMKVNDRQFIELYRQRNPDEPLGLMHLCFDAAALDALCKTYIERGLKPSEPRKARAGNVLFNLRDLENQTLEYTQYLPGSLHTNDRGKHMDQPRVSAHMLSAAIALKDVAAGTAFFTQKLGFTNLGGAAPVRLRIAGSPSEEVELDAASLALKPRLTFGVPDVKSAERELRKRGLNPVALATGNLIVTDPDGTQLIFIAESSRGSK